MISPEILQKHYEEYGGQPDSWVLNMEATKRSIVRQVFDKFPLTSVTGKVKIAVLGASDKRYIPIHERVFSSVFAGGIDMVTLDIDAEHLGGGDKVIEHDVTTAFPNNSYDVVFSHALMKFLTSEEQIKVILNSYNALSDGGVSMHIMHPPELEGTSELRSWQHRVDLKSLQEQLSTHDLTAKVMKIKSDSSVDWLRDTTVLVLQKS